MTSKQLSIIHISDVHFGPEHRFLPNRTATGELANDPTPTLAESILSDLEQHQRWNRFRSASVPSLLLLTGDLTSAATDFEFEQARLMLEKFIQCTEVMGEKFARDRVFLGALIVEINTTCLNKKGTPDLHRGSISSEQLSFLSKQLDDARSTSDGAIKIALLHHHPVLIPAFAEAGAGYDAVENAALLLNLLNRHNFHLVLHGHKHFPHTFLFDVNCGWHTVDSNPLVIVAAGSAGTQRVNEIDEPNRGNTYNLISVRHNSKSKHTRVWIETRQLQRFNSDGTKIESTNWFWLPVKTIDRILEPTNFKEGQIAIQRRAFSATLDQDAELKRCNEYKRLRGNMPIVKVIPSLTPTQEFEAHMRIEFHSSEDKPAQPAKSVSWSAGPKHSVSLCAKESNPNFQNVFKFYGPMLIRVTLTFDDGESESTFIYAHMPS